MQANLTNIVTSWIDGDPLLSKHIRYDRPTDSAWDLNEDGLYLGCCCPTDKIPHAIACINNTLGCVLSWEFTQDDFGLPLNRCRFIELTPADPQFFEKLKHALIISHNSLTDLHKCLA